MIIILSRLQKQQILQYAISSKESHIAGASSPAKINAPSKQPKFCFNFATAECPQYVPQQSTIITLISSFIENKEMSERKTWTTEEDQILRQIYERRGVKKWSKISELMEEEYRIKGRSGKQCRERYHNHLKGGIKKEGWTPEEEQQLVQLHAIHGNKWALISKLISGRTENCVKNMFNSKLRKSVRLLNRFIYLYYRKQLKQIKVSFVNRLSEFSEAAHKKAEADRNPNELAAIEIKNEILMQGDYQVHEMSQSQKMRVRGLVEQIHTFKKQNHKHYRANVLARLRKQKLRLKGSQDRELMELKQEQPQPGAELEPEGKAAKKKGNERNISGFDECIQCVGEAGGREDNAYNYQESERAEPLGRGRRRSVQRMQSIQSNCSILANQGLERPIPVDNYLPTPNCARALLDWDISVIDWRFD